MRSACRDNYEKDTDTPSLLKKAMSKRIFFRFKAAFNRTKSEIGWNIISFKTGTYNLHNPVVCHPNLHWKLRERLSTFYLRLYGRMWLAYVFVLIISILLENEHGMNSVSRKSWIDYSNSRKGNRNVDIDYRFTHKLLAKYCLEVNYCKIFRTSSTFVVRLIHWNTETHNQPRYITILGRQTSVFYTQLLVFITQWYTICHSNTILYSSYYVTFVSRVSSWGLQLFSKFVRQERLDKNMIEQYELHV
jgi:hypothetical protein